MLKRSIWVLAMLLLAMPLLAQEEGGTGLPSSLFGGGDFNRGEQANPMDAIKKFFARANVTIAGDQEKTIKPIVETAFKQVQDTVERLGGQGRGRGRGERNPQLTAELQKINDEVLTKIVASLKPDQQSVFKKWQNTEIKKAGGFAALKIIMLEAGAPLTAEQEPQIQALYATATEGTMVNVVKLLTPAQRKALLDSRTKQ